MKPEVLILSAIFIGTLCNGFRDRYSRMRALLRRPGGLGVPLLPPDKKYIPEDLFRELQRIQSKQLPLLPPDKRTEFSSFPGKPKPLPLLPPDKKSRKPRSDSEDATVSKRLMLPDEPSFNFKSSNDVHEVPFWRTWGKPRRLLLLPPDKREMFGELESNSVAADLFMPLQSALEDEMEYSFKRPLPLLPPDKKGYGAGPFLMNKRRWASRGLGPRKRRLMRSNSILQVQDEKDKAVVNLIESASEVLHNLAEQLKAYNAMEKPIGFPYDDNDLGKRVPLLPFESSEGRVGDFENSVASAIAEAELGLSRPERSAGLHYKEFQSTPRRKLPLLPFDKRSP